MRGKNKKMKKVYRIGLAALLSVSVGCLKRHEIEPRIVKGIPTSAKVVESECGCGSELDVILDDSNRTYLIKGHCYGEMCNKFKDAVDEAIVSHTAITARGHPHGNKGTLFHYDAIDLAFPESIIYFED